MAQIPSSFSDCINPAFFQRYPAMLTLITTYRCNAQCEQCCFESNPHVKGGLSEANMLRYLNIAKQEFPALKIVVFTGGECFLIGNALFAAIKQAVDLGFATRCVSNGFWGKSVTRANSIADKLVDCGIGEINFSTGLDHQKWVPVGAVVNATRALAERGVYTLITVESDTPDSHCYEDLFQRLRSELLMDNPFINVCSNTWMPFKGSSTGRANPSASKASTKSCDQIFGNVVITPYRKLAACCGLTLEHIGEMRLGDVSLKNSQSLSDLYWAQLNDLLKIWIHLDGPERIVRSLFCGDEIEDFGQIVHRCQACAILHNNPDVRERLKRDFVKYIPEILNRFLAKRVLEDIEVEKTVMSLARTAI